MNEHIQGNNQNAVSLYGQDGPAEDFPVLKAFQQYIDAEQAKARKRLVYLGIFFGVLTMAVIAVFVALLINMSHRNQMLNDRLVDFVIKDRDRPPVVVQQPQNQDNAAIISLTAKMGEIQQKLIENQQKAEEAERARKAAEAERLRKAEEAERARKAEEAERLRKAEEAERIRKAAEELEKARKAAEEAERARKAALAPKVPTPQEIEIAQLKALLAAEVERNKQNALSEKQKAEAEKKRKREEELEAYRRKHYPELYAQEDEEGDEEDVPVIRTKRRKTKASPSRSKPRVRRETEAVADEEDIDDVLDTVDDILKDKKARRYFDDEEQPVKPRKESPKPEQDKDDKQRPAAKAPDPVPVKVAAPKPVAATNKVVSATVKKSPSPKPNAPKSNTQKPNVEKPTVQMPKTQQSTNATVQVAAPTNTAAAVSVKRPSSPKPVSPQPTNATVKAAAPASPKAEPTSTAGDEEVALPVGIKGKSSSWRIP